MTKVLPSNDFQQLNRASVLKILFMSNNNLSLTSTVTFKNRNFQNLLFYYFFQNCVQERYKSVEIEGYLQGLIQNYCPHALYTHTTPFLGQT